MKATVFWIASAFVWAFAGWAWATAIAKSQEARRKEIEERHRPQHPDVDRLEAIYRLPATWTPQERPEWLAKFERENERWDR